jgi:MFS family permease
MNSLLIPLGGTVAAQTAAAMLTLSIPVVGPAITEMLGIAPERVGLLTAACSLGTVWFMTVSRLFLNRFGPVRSLQIGLALGALALSSFAISPWPLILLPALLVGVGYAPNAPASSVILARISTRRQTSFVFSIKQAAVPLGGAAAGVLVPFLLTRAGLEPALAAVALLALLVALCLQPLRRRFGETTDRTAPFGPRALFRLGNIIDMARAVRGSPELRLLTATGIAFSVMQSVMFAFLVTYLVHGVGLALAAAGLCFSAMAIAGVLGRLVTGWLASVFARPRLTLAALGVAGFLMSLVMASFAASWPLWALVAACALAGFATASWNGIYLGEIARAAPEGEVGRVTAGSTFFVFTGYTCGPVVFGALVTLTGGYALPYVLAGLGILAAGVRLARSFEPAPPEAAASD